MYDLYDSIVVKIIDSKQDDLSSLYHLRSKFLRKKNISKNDFIIEEYDKYSVHFVAYLKNAPIGALTLVKRRPLPIEKYFNIDSLYGSNAGVCEAKKFIVISRGKRKSELISLKLISSMCKYFFKNGYLRLFVTVSQRKEKNVSMYKSLGFKEFGRYIGAIKDHITALYLDVSNSTNLRRLGINIKDIEKLDDINTKMYSKDIMSRIFFEYMTTKSISNDTTTYKKKSIKKGKDMPGLVDNINIKEKDIDIIISSKITKVKDQKFMWAMYKSCFEKLVNCAQLQMCYNKDVFFSALENNKLLKCVVSFNKKIIGFSIFTNDLEEASIAYINPLFYKDRYPKLVKDNKIYYVTVICISDFFSSNILVVKTLLKNMINFIISKKAIVAFDVSENKNFLLPFVIKKIGQEIGIPVSGKELDSQMYWECHDIRLEDSMK